MLDTLITILFVGMNNSLSITVCLEMMPSLLEFLLELLIVINLPIEHDKDALVFVENRLMSPGKVNDCKPAHTQCDALAYPGSLIIWSTMANNLTHAIYKLLCFVSATFAVDESRYSTHKIHPFGIPESRISSPFKISVDGFQIAVNHLLPAVHELSVSRKA